MTEPSQNQASQPDRSAILHVCKREMLRPLRDQILRVSGYQVDSTLNIADAMSMLSERAYALVLIDVEGQHRIAEAEKLCADIKSANHEQLIAFVCNWRVAVLTDCPDDIVRTEFDPSAFVKGVNNILANN